MDDTRVARRNPSANTQVSEVMTEEKKPAYSSFPEFVARLFYKVYAQDRIVSIEQVNRLLATRFAEVSESRRAGNIIFWGSGFAPELSLRQIS